MVEKERELKHAHLQAAFNLAQKHKAAETRLINEIAEWIAAEVKDRGKLDHHEAANAIRQRRYYEGMLGSKLIIEARERDDRDGSIRAVYRFSPPVLEAFGKLTGNTVKWGKKDRYWVVVKPKARSAKRLRRRTTQRDLTRNAQHFRLPRGPRPRP
jgi:hypothetical protein